MVYKAVGVIPAKAGIQECATSFSIQHRSPVVRGLSSVVRGLVGVIPAKAGDKENIS